MLKSEQLIAASVGIALLLGSTGSSTWIDNKQNWADRWGISHDSYIVAHFHESPVTSTFTNGAGTFIAEGAAVVFPGVTAEASRAATLRMTAHFKDREFETREKVDLESAWLSNIRPDDSFLQNDYARWQSTLGSLGIRMHDLTVSRLNTGPYNRVAKREGYSEATFLIFDGRELFHNRCSILIAYRTDRVRQWGLRSIHDIFSFGYEPRTIDVLTSTETSLVEGIRRLLSARAIVLPFHDASSWYAEPLLWKNLKAACQ